MKHKAQRYEACRDGTKDETWLDSNGVEHSDKLHLTREVSKNKPDMIQYSVTCDAPVVFTETLDISCGVEAVDEYRLIEYVCMENKKDLKRLQPTPRQQ